ncbi:MAG: bifunctional aspartate kinase/homoserine dehydrogenase I [Acidobacteria bacterium]|nr:bifunctional aspartate kinase/homoserine dehydrogenase I [Acidobacteriota bacterium]MCA1618401.1 bifunctional aspartate kinase/homoserine dehydrogenase I [Acidobacteriota bacterium]
MSTTWIVHKFGGTSVADAGRYRSAAGILLAARRDGARTAVVVSAMSGVTDALLEVVSSAARRDDGYLPKLRALRERHLEAVGALGLGAERRRALEEVINSDFHEIEEVLRGVWIARLDAERIREFVSGYGELWSAQFLAAHLASTGAASDWLDARRVLAVEPAGPGVAVDWELSRKRLDAWRREEAGARIVVVTGYVASTRDGVATTLRRNGSDFSASIFAALLDAESVTIWTDVDGVLSADPRRVPDALVVPELTYEEASELAYFGAKVVHPNTMAPAISRGIPIWIRNTFNPDAPGTRISAAPRTGPPVKGFATVEGMSLVNVEGTGMIGVPGVAHKLFGALGAAGVSVVMISQASSEHSICFAVPSAQGELARLTVEEAFFAERHRGEVQMVEVEDGRCILAMVGEGMIERVGVAGQFFGALGKAGVNVRAIAQGSSERNISAVIEQREATRALRAVHSAFYLSSQTVSVGVVGTGLIGGTFLDQLGRRLERLRAGRGIDLRVRGVMSSRRMLLDERGVGLDDWRDALASDGVESDLERFVEHVHAGHLPHAVIIDATASDEMPAHYEGWLARGLHVITPNKKANSGPAARYRSLREAARRHGRYFLYETNVGAGLPIIHTLRDLVETGDEVRRVEGVFSGTLSFIFNSLDGSRAFSELVRDAHARGFTEPDPRDDLSGTDVARKLIILARELGHEIELEDVSVESLVPQELRAAVSAEEFMGGLARHDAAMSEMLRGARERGEVLRYVGTIDEDGRASAGLRPFPAGHAFANLQGSDNVVSFRTARYDAQPMIVRGPGAGPEVTAAGVFSDLLRLATFLGAPQ